MKTLILLMANIFCLSAYASDVTSENLVGESSPNSVRTVVGKGLEEYIKAVRLALWNVRLDCQDIVVDSRADGIGADLNDASLLHISESGAQPLLVFKIDGSKTRYKGSVSITTSADYKTILQVYRDHYKFTTVNKGDLRNPRFENEAYYTFKQLCTLKK